MSAGRVAPGFEAVAEEFGRNFAERGELGASFAAYVDGELVLDVWGGLADRRGGSAWREDTLVGIFSGSKGLLATCMLLLIERGQLDLDAPVCRYWPEFAAHGKERVLVRHAVSHRAGVPGLAEPVTVEEAADDRRMAALLAAQAPLAPPGERTVYHALTFGWLCGELVRRVDGRSIGRFFAEEVAGPLGLECWIGLPEAHEPRVAVLESASGFAAALDDVEVDPLAWSVFANPPRFVDGDLAANARGWHAAEIPATNAIVAARGLARLYACLAGGGELDGVRLLRPQTIELARRCLGRGRGLYSDTPLAFGVGFELQSDALPLGPVADAFGHRGAGGSVHGAWPAQRVGFSYAMNLLVDVGAGDERSAALLAAMHRVVSGKRQIGESV